MAYLYDLTDTWNAAGTVFNAIKMNVTNTASAAGSKIVSLQVGATDRFTVDKDGNGYFSGTLQAVGSISSPNLYIGANSGTIGMQDNTASIMAYNATGSGGITNTLRFITGAAERVRIDGSGNVGIGTSSPGVKLDVVGAGVFRVDGSGTTTPLILRNNNTASVQAVKLGFDNSGAIKSSINAAVYGNDYMTFNVGSDTERMRITSSGNVGIGTSSPGAKLVIRPTTDVNHLFSYSGTAAQYLAVNNASSAYIDWLGYANTFQFYTASTERMRIDASGNVGIGTSSPSSKFVVSNSGAAGFEINPTGSASAPALYSYNRNTNAYDILTTLASEVRWQTGASPSERMRLDSSGNLGLGVTPSAWSASGSVFQMVRGYIRSDGNTTSVGNNAYYNGSNWIYSANGYATYYDQYANTGTHAWFTAPSGTAGNAISFTQAMTLDASGNLLVGTTTTEGRVSIKLPVVGAYNEQTAGWNVSNGTGAMRLWIANLNYAGVGANEPWLHSYQNINIGSDANIAIKFISGGEKARIDSSGNLLVGSTTNSARLFTKVTDGSNSFGAAGTTKGVRITHDSTMSTIAGVDYTLSASYQPLGINGSDLRFLYSGTEGMRLDSSGSLLVGTTTAGEGQTSAVKQTVRATAGNNIAAMFVNDAGSNQWVEMCWNKTGGGSQLFTQFAVGTTYTGIGSITANSGATGVNYNTSSDARLKHDIVDAPEASTLIDSIKVRSFKWNADNSEQRYGMVAQELLEVAPEAVSVPADEEAMMGVDYSKLVPMLIKEIQSLRARVAQLEGN